MAEFTCTFTRLHWGEQPARTETVVLYIQAEPDGEDYAPVDDAAWAALWDIHPYDTPAKTTSWGVEIRQRQ